MENKPHSKSILAVYGLMVLFGWWVPNDLLEKSPLLQAYCDFMASIIPQIDRVTVLGGEEVGNFNRVAYSIFWAVALALSPVLIIRKLKNLKRDGFPKKSIPLWQALLLPVFCAWIAWNALTFSWIDMSLRAVNFGVANRLGATFMAPLLALSPMAFLFISLAISWGLISGRIQIGGNK